MTDNCAQVDEGIAVVARGAMEKLVNPAVNIEISSEVENFFRRVEGRVKDSAMRECVRAGLWVLADDLGAAHKICQEIGNKYGAAWHAVVHRREGDFWNSKYWWRRASGVKWTGLKERVRTELREVPGDLAGWMAGADYDAAGLVDLVERHGERGTEEVKAALVVVQRMEWLALFGECVGE